MTLASLEMYLNQGYVSFFTIHSGYIQDTFKIQCILTLRYETHKIHSRYMSDTFGIHQDTYLEPYLRWRLALDARGDAASGASLRPLAGALAGATQQPQQVPCLFLASLLGWLGWDVS